MRTLLALVLALRASAALAETIPSLDTASSDASAHVVGRGYQLASFDPGVSNTLAVGPLDMAGFEAVEAFIENVGSTTSGSCAAYLVRDGDDTGTDPVFATTAGKVAIGAGFTVAAGAVSFAPSVGRGTAAGYNVMALPRRLYWYCNPAQFAQPKLTIHAR